MSENVLQRESEASYIVKGSTFKAFSIPAPNSSNFKIKHYELKMQFSDSSHICYAYRIKIDNRLDEFSSDDGEPKGSSGQPILNTLKRKNLVNSAIYVVRYFGGCKLGISGLINAYGTAARLVLENNSIIPMVLTKKMSITYQYEIQNKVEYILQKYEIIIIKTEFGSSIIAELEVENAKINILIETLISVSNGLVKID
jgi:uncharacterized YigZ family protein